VSAPPSASRLDRDCAELAASIALARDTAAKGGAIELAPLTARLEALLDSLATVPQLGRKRHLPQLLGLFEEVEALAQVIDGEAGRCRDEITRSSSSARAIAAYAKRAGH